MRVIQKVLFFVLLPLLLFLNLCCIHSLFPPSHPKERKRLLPLLLLQEATSCDVRKHSRGLERERERDAKKCMETLHEWSEWWHTFFFLQIHSHQGSKNTTEMLLLLLLRQSFVIFSERSLCTHSVLVLVVHSIHPSIRPCAPWHHEEAFIVVRRTSFQKSLLLFPSPSRKTMAN